MISFLLASVMAYGASGGCIKFDLSANTKNQWQSVTLNLSSKNSNNTLAITSGKKYEANYECDSKGSLMSCYGVDDKGEFFFEKSGKNYVMEFERFMVGPREKAKTIRNHLPEAVILGRKVKCPKF